jgi:hypothetical protein
VLLAAAVVIIAGAVMHFRRAPAEPEV